MVKQAIKSASAVTARYIPRAPGTSRRVVCLCYHSVHPREQFATVTPQRFEEHLGWLSEECEIVPFGSVLNSVLEVDEARPAVAMTFDDGYADNYHHALPLLERYRTTATIFLTLGLIEGDPAVRDRFRELRGTFVEPLRWSQVKELDSAGMEIGAHTYSHPNLTRLERGELHDELQTAKALLEDRLGHTVDSFAYPFGKPRRHFTPATVEAVRAAGYRQAASVLFRGVRPSDDPLRIPRFFVARDSVAELAAKVRGHWDHVGFWQNALPLPMARLVSPQDFRW